MIVGPMVVNSNPYPHPQKESRMVYRAGFFLHSVPRVSKPWH